MGMPAADINGVATELYQPPALISSLASSSSDSGLHLSCFSPAVVPFIDPSAHLREARMSLIPSISAKSPCLHSVSAVVGMVLEFA